MLRLDLHLGEAVRGGQALAQRSQPGLELPGGRPVPPIDCAARADRGSGRRPSASFRQAEDLLAVPAGQHGDLEQALAAGALGLLGREHRPLVGLEPAWPARAAARPSRAAPAPSRSRWNAAGTGRPARPSTVGATSMLSAGAVDHRRAGSCPARRSPAGCAASARRGCGRAPSRSARPGSRRGRRRRRSACWPRAPGSRSMAASRRPTWWSAKAISVS